MGTTQSSESKEFAAYLRSLRTTTEAEAHRAQLISESYSLTPAERESFRAPMVDTATYASAVHHF